MFIEFQIPKMGRRRTAAGYPYDMGSKKCKAPESKGYRINFSFGPKAFKKKRRKKKSV